MICERCGRDIYKYDRCDYCKRKMCNDCIKSSKRISRTTKVFICKDCWSNIKTRGKYKSTVEEEETATIRRETYR